MRLNSPISLYYTRFHDLKKGTAYTIMKQDKIEDALVAQYDLQGTLQALRDELEPITNRINGNHPFDQKERVTILAELTRDASTIDALLNVLGRLSNQVTNNLEQLENDNSKKEDD